MLKKTVLSILLLATVAGSSLGTVNVAQAQQYDRRPRQNDGDFNRQPPPPPGKHRHHNNGGIIAGGVAAGLLGGIIGGALANGDVGYAPPPPPQPRCWFEDRQVDNQYDDGWHREQVRVCN